MKTEEERKRESDAWNNWKPGSGRKGRSPDWERHERMQRWTQEIRKEREERNKARPK